MDTYSSATASFFAAAPRLGRAFAPGTYSGRTLALSSCGSGTSHTRAASRADDGALGARLRISY